MNHDDVSFFFRIGSAIAVALVGYVIAFFSRWGFQKAFLRVKGDETVVIFLSHILFWILFVAALITAINQTGLYTTSFVAAFGAVFAALIISLQKTLSNFAGGVILLLQRPYKIGDTITILAIEGKVTEMNVFTTRLNVNGKTALIPNGVILGSPLIIQKAEKPPSTLST